MFHGHRRISPKFSAQALLRSRMMIADAFIVPKFSTATGWKMCVLSKPAYLAALRVAAASAVEPAFVAESPMHDSAKGQTTVTSQVSGFPSLQGTIVSPSGRLPSALETLRFFGHR